MSEEKELENETDGAEVADKMHSKEAGAILQLSQHMDEFFSTVFTVLASVEANLVVNQNLMMTMLSAKGFSDEEIEALKKQNAEHYKEYKNILLKAHATKLGEFKDHFSKLYAE